MQSEVRAIVPRDVRLGFGTASLVGSRTHDEAVRLLEQSIDAGIRYFDTARMYGSGRAEAALGAVARRHRDRMIIVSKAGILPESLSFQARLARKVAGRLKTAEPQFAKSTFHVFDTRRFRESVERSLTELGVERIDILLLHEATPRDITDDLMRLLDELVAAGKVGAYGLATEPEPTRAIAQQEPRLAGIVQFPNSVWQHNLPAIRAVSQGVIGTHSIMGTRFQQLSQRLTNDQPMRQRWSESLGFDTGEGRQLGSLFIAEALTSNPDGVVLFSSGNPQNIANNVVLAKAGPDAKQGQIEALRRLVAEDCPA